MPPRRRLTSITLRRHARADNILAFGIFTMRPCSSYMSFGVLCVLSPVDERCEQCYRNQRPCELAPPWTEFAQLQKEKEKVQQQRLESELKTVRLRKQKRSLLKRIKALSDKEELNILDLEVDEAAAEAVVQKAANNPPTAVVSLIELS
jgi:hypothetical protein